MTGLTNRYHFVVVCSVIDTWYDVLIWQELKVSQWKQHLNLYVIDKIRAADLYGDLKIPIQICREYFIVLVK